MVVVFFVFGHEKKKKREQYAGKGITVAEEENLDGFFHVECF